MSLKFLASLTSKLFDLTDLIFFFILRRSNKYEFDKRLLIVLTGRLIHNFLFLTVFFFNVGFKHCLLLEACLYLELSIICCPYKKILVYLIYLNFLQASFTAKSSNLYPMTLYPLSDAIFFDKLANPGLLNSITWPVLISTK